MYNGIGLQTARGSGTNGYVQRNLSFVKQTKNKVEYRTEDDFRKLEAELNRTPNQEILDHQKKRQIELKCIQMQEKMEEQGYSSEEIEKKVKEYRVVLNEQVDEPVNKKEWLSDRLYPNVKETHQMAQLNLDKNDKLKNALKISSGFIEGSSLDPNRKAKEALAAATLLQQKRYALIKDPSPEPQVEPKDEKRETKSHEKRKKKEKSRKEKSSKKHNSRKYSSESESDSDSDSYHSGSNSKKRRKTKSHEKRIKDKKYRKKREHKSRKHAKYSESSSGSDSETSTDSSSESGTSSSSNSSDYNSRKERYSSKRGRKYSSSPEITRKLKSHYDFKGSSFQKEDQKTSDLIERNIKEVRKETENSMTVTDKQKVIENNEKKQTQQTRDSNNQKRMSPDSRSRSSSDSPVHDPRVKRLKSAVYESDGSKKAKEIPKSYSSNYYQSRSESRNNRSLSPNDKSRHSSRSQHRSRSRSLKSKDSRSSNHSSRSSSSASSRSLSRSRSRSPSIPRRKGSPSFLDKRRITRY